MKPLTYSLFAFLFFTPFFLNAQCDDLFFSEYIEGSSNNKAIEVYNASNSSISLSDYEIHLFSNGNTSANSAISLSGSLGSDSVYVISNSSAGLTGITNEADQFTGALNFNGDDALALINTITNDTLDLIGVIGQQSIWSISGINSVNGTTQNQTLVRDPFIQSGQKNWSIGSTEWIVLPNNEDDSIGFHYSVCNNIIGFTAIIQRDSIVRCFGQATAGLSATLVGGVPPFQYRWSTNDTTAFIDSLGAGTYSLTVTDSNNDSAIVSDTINQPIALTLTLSKSDVFCFGDSTGNINSSINGGSSPYSYSWSDTNSSSNRSGLTAGTYVLSVTDSLGCSQTDSTTISQPSPLVTSITIDSNVTTFGGSDGGLSANTVGGTPPYEYNWSTADTTTSISGLSAASYTLTVTDSLSCITRDSATITQPAGALAELIITEIMYNPPESGSDSLEFIEMINAGLDTIELSNYRFRSGVNFTFGQLIIPPSEYFVGAVDSSSFRNVFGFDPDFIWTSGALSNGGEAITLEDNIGRLVDSVNYTNSSPWPSGTGSGEPDGGGASIELNDNLLDNNIGSNWTASTDLVIGQIINGAQVYASPGAPNSIIISTDKLQSTDRTFKLFPNPSDGQLNIELNAFNEKLPFDLINADGKVIYENWIHSKKTTLNLKELNSGVYFIRLENEVQKLIISAQ